jgi:hypothetical protein
VLLPINNVWMAFTGPRGWAARVGRALSKASVNSQVSVVSRECARISSRGHERGVARESAPGRRSSVSPGQSMIFANGKAWVSSWQADVSGRLPDGGTVSFRSGRPVGGRGFRYRVTAKNRYSAEVRRALSSRHLAPDLCRSETRSSRPDEGVDPAVLPISRRSASGATDPCFWQIPRVIALERVDMTSKVTCVRFPCPR